MQPFFRNPSYRGKPICHIHIPKCAGDSLVAALREALGPRELIIPDAVAIYLAARQSRHCQNETEFETLQLVAKQTHLLYHLNRRPAVLSGHLAWSVLHGSG